MLAAGFNSGAQPSLETNSPVGFFTLTADRFLKSRAGVLSGCISTANIPIYPANFYTPSLHRLLQLAANIYDATTNKAFGPDGFDYPSVFRPTFNRNGTSVYISGYVEETPEALSYRSRPLCLSRDFASVGADTINVYGIPWVIGARAGLPNFNEFSMQGISQITRNLELIRPSIGSPRSVWHTNIQYTVGISNVVGVEAWNSYAANIGRPVHLITDDDLTMVLTNETGLVLVSNNITAGTNWVYSTNAWPGSVNLGNSRLTAMSFQVPLYANFVSLPDSIYQQNPPAFVPNQTGFIETTIGYPLPHFVLSVTNRLRFIMLDQNSGRVIDYVQLDGMNAIRDLTAELPNGSNDFAGVWNTNRGGNTSSLVPYDGIINQIAVSSGALPISPEDWNNSQLRQVSNLTRQEQISEFDAFYNNDPAITNLSIQIPFAPTRKVSQYFTWQANDPLVHYMLGDLTAFPQTNSLAYWVPSIASNLGNTIVLPNLGKLNDRYAPWGGNPNTGGQGETNAFNLALKDPLVSRSDDWQFPANPNPSPGWLGGIHRGTPWQTIYLKSPVVDPNAWQDWIGNADTYDAKISQPTNDWRLASLLVFLLNTKDPGQLFSVNQTNLGAALNGITVLTNTDSGLTSLSMASNSPQAAVVVNAINFLRSSQPDQFFHDVGDILAAPELSVASPWLATNGSSSNAITDLAYEIIPSQLLFLLRPDSIGSVISASGSTQIQFTGLDGYTYIVQGSTNLQEWTPIAAEVATNGSFIFTDANATNVSERYYRTLLSP